MRWSTWTIALAIAVVSTTAFAGNDKAHATKKEAAKAKQAPPPEEPATGSADGSAAMEDPFDNLPRIVGPKLISLGHQAEIDLPAGMTLFEADAAKTLVRKGGSSGEGVVAAIVPPVGTWVVLIEADDAGYVTDSDADELDANSMLESFKQGTIAQNVRRREMKIPELFVDGWTNPPKYEKAKHHLIWGLDLHDSDGKIINFFTRFLGRNGYLSVNLIDSPENIEQSKVQALTVLQAVRFQNGARYEDHADGDKSSGLGLKALVIGGGAVLVAKKTGLLVVLLLALKKGFIVVIAAIGGFFKWITGRKKKEEPMSINLPPNDPYNGPPPGDPPPQV